MSHEKIGNTNATTHLSANFSESNYHLLLEGDTVYLIEQKAGEPPSQSVEIPKLKFDTLIAKYAEPRKFEG